jgi:hypothetical protein
VCVCRLLYGPTATAREQAVLDAVEAALGMGVSVEHFTEEIAPSFEWGGPTQSLKWHGYVMPLFINE